MTGKTAMYRQCTKEEMAKSSPDRMFGEEIADMFDYSRWALTFSWNERRWGEGARGRENVWGIELMDLDVVTQDMMEVIRRC